MFALRKSAEYKGLIPPYVVLTQPQGRFSEEGSGTAVQAFRHRGRPQCGALRGRRRGGKGITEERQRAPVPCAKANTMGKAMAANPQLAASAEARKQAYEADLGTGRGGVQSTQRKPNFGKCSRRQHVWPGLSGGATDGSKPGFRTSSSTSRGGGIPHSTTFPPCGANARNWTRASRSAAAESARPRIALQSTLARRCGQFGCSARERLAAALGEWRGVNSPTATFSTAPQSPAAVSRAATLLARPTLKPRISRTGPCTPYLCSPLHLCSR